jgi:hypothetical protein
MVRRPPHRRGKRDAFIGSLRHGEALRAGGAFVTVSGPVCAQAGTVTVIEPSARPVVLQRCLPRWSTSFRLPMARMLARKRLDR